MRVRDARGVASILPARLEGNKYGGSVENGSMGGQVKLYTQFQRRLDSMPTTAPCQTANLSLQFGHAIHPALELWYPRPALAGGARNLGLE